MEPEPVDVLVRQTVRLLRSLDVGLISEDDFLYNFVVTLVHAAYNDDRVAANTELAWQACLDRVPKPLINALDNWLHLNAANLDYKPSPAPFLVNTTDSELQAATRLKLRPLYVALHELIGRMAEVAD